MDADIHPLPITTREANELIKNADGVCVARGPVYPDGWLRTLVEEVEKRHKLNVQFAGASVPCWVKWQNSGGKNDARRPRIVRYLCGSCIYVTRAVIETVGALDERLGLCQAMVEWQNAASGQMAAKSLWVPGVWCERERCTRAEMRERTAFLRRTVE